MPILKPIAGHAATASVIKNYLEKNGRALERDFYNLSWDDRTMTDYSGQVKAKVSWDIEMDRTRHAFGNDTPWNGRPARTYKHFILSPDPDDRIALEELRELSRAWALRFFPDHEIAVVYHDDNKSGIPHAHIVVNNTDLRTGRRMHTEHPEDLNRALQEMAAERGLSALSNTYPEKSPIDRPASNGTGASKPRSRQSTYLGQAERGLAGYGGYSWVADIRGRVAVAKTLSHSEEEFMRLLEKMEVTVCSNSEKARREDWIFSLADQPTKKVSGERLGMSFSKESLQRRFGRQGAYHPTQRSEAIIQTRAEHAIELNDLADLDRLAGALETCARFNVRSIEDFDRRLSKRIAPDSEAHRSLVSAREYMSENGLLPQRIARSKPVEPKKPSASHKNTRAEAAKRQARIQAQVRQQEQQRHRRKER